MITRTIIIAMLAALFVSGSQSIVFADPASEQYAGKMQNGSVAGEKADYSATMEPRQAKSKVQAVPIQKADKGQENMKRYKMPAEGEGERKVR
jgi:hypothetical protein